MACLFPGAANLRQYWQNIVARRGAIGDPPADWEAEKYLDPAATGNDRTYCVRGGYLGPLARFDPFEFGVMPKALDGGEPDHFLTLRVARDALVDAGYSPGSVDPRRVEVVLGRGTYINRGVTNLFQHGVVVEQTLDVLRELHPEYSPAELQAIKRRLKDCLPPFSADTVPGMIPNVLAGRIANRLDFMGAAYIVDAACASSLLAVESGMADLRAGKCDMALVGGVNASLPPPILMVFSQINALSRSGALRPFDAASDGTLLGEGIGVVVLKRRSDALQSANRIYALLKSVGIASDGRAQGLLAPRREGQALAVRRAYEAAGVDPHSVGLIEAHGTGVPLGDLTEIQALTDVFGPRRGGRPTCALGTVKSSVGHLLTAAGIAGLIKAALALHHKLLPPMIGCERPSPLLRLEETPFFVCAAARPWIRGRDEPRRAAVSAFGFGGINAHALLEEHPGDEAARVNLHSWPASEVFLFRGESREQLAGEIRQVAGGLAADGGPDLGDLAYTLNTRPGKADWTLAAVSDGQADLRRKLDYAAGCLQDPRCLRIQERSGVYFFNEPLGETGKVAFLFPGEGSQYRGMMAGLAMHFPEARAAFDLVDQAFAPRRDYLPSHAVFPTEEPAPGDDLLWAMDTAAESLFAATQAMLAMVRGLKIRPDALVGHSTGEYSALMAAGVFDLGDEGRLIDFIVGVNGVYQRLAAEGRIAKGVLLSVGGVPSESVLRLVEECPDELYLAMDNCPHQYVLCGTAAAADRAERVLSSQGGLCQRLAFDRAYHTPWFEPVRAALAEHFSQVEFHPPQIDVFSCMTAGLYPGQPAAVREMAVAQWARRVRFRETVEAMAEAGIRIFVEVGPGNHLTAFVADVLKGKPHLAVAANVARRSDLTQLAHLVALLFAHHVPLDPAFLYVHRACRRLELTAGPWEPAPAAPPDRSVEISRLLPRIRLGALATGRGPSETAPPEPSHAEVAGDGRLQAMLNYMQTMQEFVKTQEEVCLARFARGDAKPYAAAPVAEAGSRPLPLVHEVLSLSARRAVAVCRLALCKDGFLRDHVLGGKVSCCDPELAGLAVVPLTFSMEILAQAASLLAPGEHLVRMTNIRAYRWIGLDDGQRALQVVAEAEDGPGHSIRVQLRELAESNPESIAPGLPIVEGVAEFAAAYPTAPPADPLPLTAPRPSKWSGRELYGGFMFHGPALQAVASMDEWAEDGATATLRAMPADTLFDGLPDPLLLSDPVLLDAAGQVIAYWAAEHLTDGFHVFPFRLESLDVFGPGLRAPATGECRARIVLVEDRLIRSDIDVLGDDGRLHCRLSGWWDRRFPMTKQFEDLLCNPREGFLSLDCPEIAGTPAGAEQTQVCLFHPASPDLQDHDRLWERVLAHLVLSRRERAEWKDIVEPARRLDWLAGRIAAKDAVRALLRRRGGPWLCPADVEIAHDDHGRPLAVCPGRAYVWEKGDRHHLCEAPSGPFRQMVPVPFFPPSICLTHSSGSAAAAAAYLPAGLSMGIDAEVLRPLESGFDEIAFSPAERQWLDGLPDAERPPARTTLWCVKESVAKALGIGAAPRPADIVVKWLARNEGSGSQQSQPWEKGDRHHLCEAPSGPFRQMVPVPFFPPKIVQGHLEKISAAAVLSGPLADRFPEVRSDAIMLWRLQQDGLIVVLSLVKRA
jgi:acyl transferase domain-containing protein/4'-phosphopantetheinyl transferase EntD